MSRSCTFVIAAMILAVSAWGQHRVVPADALFLGPVAGLGNSSVTAMPDIVYKSSGVLGVEIIKLSRPHIAWGMQALFSSEGYEVDAFSSLQKITPIYLRIPIRGYYFFGRPGSTVRPNVFLGPSIAVKMAEHSYTSAGFTENYVIRNSDVFRRADIGINGGAGLKFFVGGKIWVNTDLVFYQGLTDAIKTEDQNYEANQRMGLDVGILFNMR